MAGEVSPEVRAFITKTIDSVEQLEVLLFLMSNAEREWSPAEVSERTRLTAEAVTSRMAELHAAQLLSARKEPKLAYRYAPASKALAAEVGESLQQAYRERRETIVQLIYSRPLDNIRVFADAFRIKKEDV